MQVFRGIPGQAAEACVLTIGNFDGVHRGHQALLRLLCEQARAHALPAVALTFEPHPREFFAGDKAPTRLASLREKLLLLAAAGVQRTHICRFDAPFSHIGASAFIDDLLVRGLALRHLIVGDDFRFGKGREGDFALLQSAGVRHGFEVEAMQTLDVAGQRVSSSAVRAALATGDMAQAERLLGRHYSIAGRVMHGEKLGRKLGFPTANVQLKHRRPPVSGIYAVMVEGLTDHLVPGGASVGIRPTVTDAGRATLEVHLLEWNRDCYGAHLRVYFLHKQRDEEKYPTLEALAAQIARDADSARDWLGRHAGSLTFLNTTA
jgi:riboflavin kinase/FMN adenylyltransferase